MPKQKVTVTLDPMRLIQALSATDDPVEKSAISAEFAIDRLPEPIAELARSCAILRWFDEHIITALLPLIEAQSGATDPAWDGATVYEQITSLTFVEHLAWGKVYHSQTAEGLLAKYGTTTPERFRALAALAAPAYLAHPETHLAQSEALYCYLVADLQDLARELLDELVLAASRREDWHRVLAYYQICDQAAELSFVTPLTYSAIDYFPRGFAAHQIDNLEQFTSEEIIELLHDRFQIWAIRVSEPSRTNILRQWKAIYLRHIVGKTSQEISQDFQSFDPTITVQQVSKYVNQGLERIRKDAYLRHLFGFI